MHLISSAGSDSCTLSGMIARMAYEKEAVSTKQGCVHSDEA